MPAEPFCPEHVDPSRETLEIGIGSFACDQFARQHERGGADSGGADELPAREVFVRCGHDDGLKSVPIV
jgi:hypothetical protein